MVAKSTSHHFGTMEPRFAGIYRGIHSLGSNGARDGLSVQYLSGSANFARTSRRSGSRASFPEQAATPEGFSSYLSEVGEGHICQ